MLNRNIHASEILIVDDNLASMDLLSQILTGQHYDVRVANNGKRALVAVKTAPPDLILLDVNMPDMNGYEVCAALKADLSTQHIPVIFISAHGETIDKVRAFSVGAVDYVTKPIQAEEVLARIECQLTIARLSRELQMQMLRYQLNPHFLFNALISMRDLIDEDAAAAKRMITQLSEYLHYLLASRDTIEIPLQEELQAIENYLAIEKIRFEEQLIVKLDIQLSDRSMLVPAFFLQPIVENAVKYGRQTSTPPLIIELSAQAKSDMIQFSISNTGAWLKEKEHYLPQNSGHGIGLQNVRQRLSRAYPGNHSFTINEAQGRVNVVIEIGLSKPAKR